MTPRALVIQPAAIEDINRRTDYLAQQRGTSFAFDWFSELSDWLARTVENDAVNGTTHPVQRSFRTFPHRHRATVLAHFTDTELRVVRIYFAGQDWMA